MTRKILKEEKVLRRLYSTAYPNEVAGIERDFKELVTPLVKAVREDERLKNQCDCDTCRKGRK